MVDIHEVPIIIPAQIIERPLANKLSNLEEVQSHLNSRYPLFLSRLAAIGKQKKCGWQNIETDDSGVVSKKPAEMIDKKALFTASKMCEFSSFSLAEALSQITAGMQIDVVEVYTNWHAENWGKPDYVLNSYPHVILTIQSGNDVVFYDPTYGQIDHRKAGKLICMTKDELSKYYKNNLEPEISYRNITDSKASKLIGIEKELHLTEGDRQALIRTIL